MVIKKLIISLGSRITKLLLEYFRDDLTSVCLYGSAVRGSLRNGSDIDFLVVLREAPLSYHKRVKRMMPLIERIRESREYKKIERLNLHLEPSLLIMTKREVESHPDILIDLSHEGIILFDVEGFLKDHFNKVKEKMLEWGSVKRETPHGHYWNLKPDLQLGEVIEL